MFALEAHIALCVNVVCALVLSQEEKLRCLLATLVALSAGHAQTSDQVHFSLTLDGR